MIFIIILALIAPVWGAEPRPKRKSTRAATPTVTAVPLGVQPTAVPTPAGPPIARTEHDGSPGKPGFEGLLKPKSLKKVLEDYDIVTNSEWTGAKSEHFAFTNGVLIRTPLSFARPRIMDFSLYPKMTSAIKKFEYDAATQTIELLGESHGMRMHSWIKVDQRYWDEIHYTIVRGDLTGFKVRAYLWDKDGKTLTIAKGELPNGSQMLPTFVRLVFKPVSEIVIGIATRNFRSYIEEEYKKQKDSARK